MNTTLFFWVIFALIMLFIELAGPGLLYFASFAFGAFTAAGAYWFGFHIVAQTIAFLVASLTALYALHALVRRSTQRNTYVSNVHALVGKRVIVIREIKQYESGAVKINGEHWPARALFGHMIPTGTLVSIKKVTGCHVLVMPVQTETKTIK